MGHLINPISTRLGLSAFWLSSWSKFTLANFSYNLMIDNVVRNLILWIFSDSRVAIQLSIVGVFLSHFKVVRKINKIRIFVVLILNSSIFLKSQSVEIDSEITAHLIELRNILNIFLYSGFNFSINNYSVFFL